MNTVYLVATGLMGNVGRFRSLVAHGYCRDDPVICRTERGLEVGRVLVATEWGSGRVDGELLRPMTPEDRLIAARLDRHRDRAFAACREFLAQSGSPSPLVDVEHLFDGESVYFYFLGNPPAEVDRLTAELSEIYDKQVKFRQFAETLAKGCGPNCGAKEGACGDSCTSCALSARCPASAASPST